jgi:hypothetical protein
MNSPTLPDVNHQKKTIEFAIDQKLVADARSGNNHAFSELWDRHSKKVPIGRHFRVTARRS